MKTKQDLRIILKKINGKGYKAYKDIQGKYSFDNFVLSIDYVQGDPFALPSRIRVISKQNYTAIPENLFDKNYKRIAVVDFLTRTFDKNIKKYYSRIGGTGKSGLLSIDYCGQEMLDRTSIIIDTEKIEVRLEIGLPATGRRILGESAEKMFFDILPIIVEKSLPYKNINQKKLIEHVQLSEDQQYIRQKLNEKGLIAFIANGSILPRESGISQKPLSKNVVPFKSPATMEIEFKLPNKGCIKGMGIKKGITLIVGGGYHGKSTLLNALELGVYNHIEGDGREYVITSEDAVKIKSEDGRRIEKVDISFFINNLPNGTSTKKFCTNNASGSTSQVANILEALELGTDLLLIDEDTSATNFMIRDARMQKLVHKDKEPIIPFIDRVKQLYEKYDVSTILVIGGSGDYFDVADTVIMMDEYIPKDVTVEAKKIAEEIKNGREIVLNDINKQGLDRIISGNTFSNDSFKLKVKSNGIHSIVYDRSEIDLNGLEQLIDFSQTRAISMILQYIKYQELYDNVTIKETVDKIMDVIEKEGIDAISNLKGHPGNLALPRKYEIGATLNRFRRLNCN